LLLITFTISQGIIGGGDHDKQVHDGLIGGDGHDLFETANLGGTLHDYIFSASRETLVQWALAAEKYIRRNKDPKFGGLDDYMTSLTDVVLAQKNLSNGKYISRTRQRVNAKLPCH